METLDLRGVACPLNYVRTVVALDRLNQGESLELWLDPGEPEDNVARSCREDGHAATVVETTTAGHVRLVVTKLAPHA